MFRGWWRWVLGGVLVAGMVAGPYVHYRSSLAHGKRLREVTPGRFYRCGQLTQEGFAAAIERYGIRTIVNLQNEDPDPQLPRDWFGGPKVPESEFCAKLGVRYVFLHPDLLPRCRLPAERPQVIGNWLAVLDDPTAYPVLVHCKAGLHRTGLLTAVYRVEYEGWSHAAAVQELKANGFGDAACSSANDYVLEYLLMYQKRKSERMNDER